MSPNSVPLQDAGQFRMVLQQSGFFRGKLSFGAVEHGIDILPGQSGGVDDAVDIDMTGMDSLGKCSACRVVPRIDGVGRRANPGANRPRRRSTNVNVASGCIEIRTQTRAVISLIATSQLWRPVNPVPHHPSRRMPWRILRRRIERTVKAPFRVQNRESAGLVPERVRPMAARHDPVTARQRRRYQDRGDPVPAIGAFTSAHVNVAPNPGAAPSTSSIRPCP